MAIIIEFVVVLLLRFSGKIKGILWLLCFFYLQLIITNYGVG